VITESDIELCRDFAHKQIKSSKVYYNDRGGNTSKIHSQIVQGKLAEIFVSRWLTSIGKFTTCPDFKIYGSGCKTFDADLELTDKTGYIHIKSCHDDVAKHFGWGWVFQKNDPIVDNPHKDHWIVLVKAYSQTEFQIHSIISSLEAIYKPTKAYFPSKCVIYAEDLP